MSTPVFQMSADARLLMQRLDTLKVGDTITYKELSDTISRDVTKVRFALATAQRRLLRDHQKVFGVVRGVGIKRLNDAEIVAEGTSFAQSIRRRARRAVERQMVADFDKLSRSEQATFTATVSVMGSIAMMTTQRALDRIEKAATPDRKELPISETLRMFAE